MKFGSIEAMAEGVVTRGVFLDVASALGVDNLDPTAAIGPAELEAAEEYWEVEAGLGDAVLVRSGRMVHEAQADPPAPYQRAGLDIEAIRWLHEREVAVYGGDCIERMPSPYPGLELPLHSLGLAAMGLALLDWPDTEALRSACLAEGRGEFVLMIAPLRLREGRARRSIPCASSENTDEDFRIRPCGPSNLESMGFRADAEHRDVMHR